MWDTADAFIAGTEAGRQRTWYQFRLDDVRAVQITANGVTLVLSFSRLARDGRVMSKDEGLFLVTLLSQAGPLVRVNQCTGVG